jgi:alkaline phosphatase D
MKLQHNNNNWRTISLLLLLTSACLSTLSLTIQVQGAGIGTGAADFVHDETLSKLAFGSCHKSIKAKTPRPIWNTIDNKEHPEAWLWTGDAIYTASRQDRDGDANGKKQKRYGPAPPSELSELYQEMHTNQTIGYASFIEPPRLPLGVYGTWDDHDMGGNDMGVDIPQKQARKKAFYQFLGLSDTDTNTDLANREGVYSSVEWGSAPRKTKAILLDTRWHRQDHCIPSVAHNWPLGSVIACVSRWLVAGLRLDRWAWMWHAKGDDCTTHSILGETQWTWLQQQLLESDAQVHILVSSIQVFTTNPTVESWGHFPKELERLVNLLETKRQQNRGSVILLSGDVHHAEVLQTQAQPGLLEVTSSGLTHHCAQHILYGHLSHPILSAFRRHRSLAPDAFYIGLNYGVIQIDWEQGSVLVQIKDDNGDAVLQVTQPIQASSTPFSFSKVPTLWDGHLIPWAQRILVALTVAVVIATRLSRQAYQ